MASERYWQMVTWHGAAGDSPVLLFAEIEAGWELRKVDLFDDGRLARAGANEADGSTVLGAATVPSIGEIDDFAEFSAVEVTREVFEAIWTAAARS
jgi:hypothetical protein